MGVCKSHEICQENVQISFISPQNQKKEIRKYILLKENEVCF